MKGKFFCIWTHAKIGRILTKWEDKTHGDYKEFKKTISVGSGQSSYEICELETHAKQKATIRKTVHVFRHKTVTE
jgi:hypothetical protein